MTSTSSRSSDGRFELRHTESLNPFVEMYGDSDEEQTDYNWELVRVRDGVVVASWGGWVDHRNLRSGTQSVEFTPDGKAVLVDGKRFEIEDLERQKSEAIDKTVHGLALTRDGKTLAVSLASGRISILDTATRQVTRTFKVPVAVSGLAWTVDGKGLVASGKTGACLLDARDGTLRWERVLGKQQPGSFVTCPDVIAVKTGYPVQVTLLNAKDGTVIREFPIGDTVIAFTSKGDAVVYRDPAGPIVAQTIKTGNVTEIRSRLKGDARLVGAIPERDRFFTKDWDHVALTTMSGTEISRHDGKARDGFVSVDGRIAIGVFDGSYNAGKLAGDPHHIRIIDVETGRELKRHEAIVHGGVAGAGLLWELGIERNLLCFDLDSGRVLTANY